MTHTQKKKKKTKKRRLKAEKKPYKRTRKNSVKKKTIKNRSKKLSNKKKLIKNSSKKLSDRKKLIKNSSKKLSDKKKIDPPLQSDKTQQDLIQLQKYELLNLAENLYEDVDKQDEKTEIAHVLSKNEYVVKLLSFGVPISTIGILTYYLLKNKIKKIKDILKKIIPTNLVSSVAQILQESFRRNQTKKKP